MFQFVQGLYLNLSLLNLSAALLTKPLSGARIDVPVRARPRTPARERDHTSRYQAWQPFGRQNVAPQNLRPRHRSREL